MPARTRQAARTPADTCTDGSGQQSAAQRARTGTGRLAPAVLRAQLDVLATQERRVRIIEPPAPPPLWISEAALQRLITDLAEWCGWYWTFNADSRHTQAGVPDLLLMRGKRLLWRELKRESGRLRPEQLAFGQRLLRAGQDWACWRPSSWDDVVRTLTAEE
jgi:hypothetical protein